MAGGIFLWINAHLGAAFYALLALIFLNVCAALWEKDLLTAAHKWMKVIMGTAIPFVIPELTKTQGLHWTDGDTKLLVGAIFAALLSSTIPDILSFINRFLSVWKVGKQTQDKVDGAVQAELDRLKEVISQLQSAPSDGTELPTEPTIHGL